MFPWNRLNFVACHQFNLRSKLKSVVGPKSVFCENRQSDSGILPSLHEVDGTDSLIGFRTHQLLIQFLDPSNFF